MTKYILGISIVTDKKEVFLTDRRKIIKAIEVCDNSKANKLLDAISSLFIDMDISNIGKIVVVNGVGPYTSTRVGVVIANALSFTQNCEIFEVNTEILDGRKLSDYLIKNGMNNLKKVRLSMPIYSSLPTITKPKCSI